MTDEVPTQSRQYFTVLDGCGAELPAVEYWAANPDGHEPTYQVVPLRRFVKLLGGGESLEEGEDGAFTGSRTGRQFSRVPRPGSAE